MKRKITTELVLEGLNCAQCGVKIEQQVLALAGITAVSVNIVNKTLILEGEDIENVPELIDKIRSIVKKVMKKSVCKSIPTMPSRRQTGS
jgi:Cd2+/Zn2+-exporting ATPase